MPKYTEGERNLRHYLAYGTYPPPPRQFKGRLGNDISELVGTHYEGERTPRQVQKLPLYNYYQQQRFAPTAIDIPRPFGATADNTPGLLALGGLALFFLVISGAIVFRGF